METKIDYLFNKAQYIEDEELQADLLNYICVILSGYLEININKIIKQCNKNDINECKDSIKPIQNATWCKIKPILALIDIKLTLKLYNDIIQTDAIDIIYNIIKNRNDIAHGKNITTLTLPKLKSDFEEIKIFIKKVQKLFCISNNKNQ